MFESKQFYREGASECISGKDEIFVSEKESGNGMFEIKELLSESVRGGT